MYNVEDKAQAYHKRKHKVHPFIINSLEEYFFMLPFMQIFNNAVVYAKYKVREEIYSLEDRDTSIAVRQLSNEMLGLPRYKNITHNRPKRKKDTTIKPSGALTYAGASSGRGKRINRQVYLYNGYLR